MFEKALPDIFSTEFWSVLLKELQVVWRIFRDPRVPRNIKILPVLLALYVILPFDLIPGFIPILGQLDDLIIVLFGLRLFVQLSPQDVVAEYKREAGLET